ncbi:Protein GAMETE EXPRESSED 3 [Linum perenne]
MCDLMNTPTEGPNHSEEKQSSLVPSGILAVMPRIVLDATDPKWPFILRRRQYPLRLCDAMTYENAILGQLFLVGGDTVSMINFQNIGTSVPAEEIFFGQEGAGEILGIAVSTLTCTVFINVRSRGLFAYSINGKLLWSAGPLLFQFGYRLGCRHGVENCYFASLPVIDQCEASLYISNTKGEVYSLSLRDPHFNWVQDLSFLDKDFTITPGNNGRLYVTIPVKAILLALDVFTGSILWQQSIGPLSTEDSKPVVDSNGWISIGSLDGFLYSISPAGIANKFTKASVSDSVIQVGPFVDCSGYAVYISQAQVEGKANQVIGDYGVVWLMELGLGIGFQFPVQ